MPDYSYSCPVCKSTVIIGVDSCSKCGCPAITTPKELNWLRESWLNSDKKKPIDKYNNPYHSYTYTNKDIWTLVGCYLLTSVLIYSMSIFLLSNTFSPHAVIGDATALTIFRIILIVILISPALLTYMYSKKIKNLHNKQFNPDSGADAPPPVN